MAVDATTEDAGEGVAPETRDYFAEMYVAGKLADAGWNVYFPRRDKGFDFIITKSCGGRFLLRPVQVKGKYPEVGTKDRIGHGYSGAISELHDDMVLAIAFFEAGQRDDPPLHIAYVPRPFLRVSARGYRCQPANLSGGRPKPRREYKWTFDRAGIEALELPDWPTRTPPPDPSLK